MVGDLHAEERACKLNVVVMNLQRRRRLSSRASAGEGADFAAGVEGLTARNKEISD